MIINKEFLEDLEDDDEVDEDMIQEDQDNSEQVEE